MAPELPSPWLWKPKLPGVFSYLSRVICFIGELTKRGWKSVCLIRGLVSRFTLVALLNYFIAFFCFRQTKETEAQIIGEAAFKKKKKGKVTTFDFVQNSMALVPRTALNVIALVMIGF